MMKRITTFCAAGAIACLAVSASAESFPGVSDTEIRIGNTTPYTGPVAAFSGPALTQAAYFKMINDRGGVNGRSLVWKSEDDGYSPPRTLLQTRKLVERDDVLLMTSVLGTATNMAIRGYLNDRGVPQLFPNTGASAWNDPAHYKWTIPDMGRPDQEAEGAAYARFLIARNPESKIGVLFQNDDFGRDFLKGFRKGVEAVAPGTELVEVPYDTSETLIDPKVDTLQNSGVDSLAVFALPKFCAQAIRRASDSGWKPTIVVGVVCTSVDFALKPAGLDNATGIYSGLWLKDPADPANGDDAEVQAFKAFMAEYYPDGNIDIPNANAYMSAYTLVHILTEAGADLSREHLRDVITSLGEWRAPMLQDGLSARLTADNYKTITEVPIVRFNGERWVKE